MREAQSPWRMVTARVHLSLPPQQLATIKESATRQAYANLLLRHNPRLGGVVVAHNGPLQLRSAPRLVGASPFVHLRATAKLLVFAPGAGCVLTGVVSHVGPDHVGLSVHGAFHAVLPIDAAPHLRFDPAAGDRPRRWHVPHSPTTPPSLDVTVGCHMCFVVASVKATESGLFQMVASIDTDVVAVPSGISLGVVADHHVVHDVISDEEDMAQMPRVRARKIEGEQLLLQGGGVFGSALAPATDMPPTPDIPPVAELHADEIPAADEMPTANEMPPTDVIVPAADTPSVAGATGVKMEATALQENGSSTGTRTGKKKHKKRKAHQAQAGESGDVPKEPTRKKRKRAKERTADDMSDVHPAADEAVQDIVFTNPAVAANRGGGVEGTPDGGRRMSSGNSFSMFVDAVNAVGVGLPDNGDARAGYSHFKQEQEEVAVPKDEDGDDDDDTTSAPISAPTPTPAPAPASVSVPVGGGRMSGAVTDLTRGSGGMVKAEAYAEGSVASAASKGSKRKRLHRDTSSKKKRKKDKKGKKGGRVSAVELDRRRMSSGGALSQAVAMGVAESLQRRKSSS